MIKLGLINHHNSITSIMKTSTIIQTSILAAAVGLSSCSSLGTYNTVSANKVGAVTEDVPATIISVSDCTQETSSSAKNLGTGLGAALGAGAGSLLGRGKGQIVSAVGFGAVGALAGRYITDAAGNTKCQRITVRTDNKPRKTLTIVQPVYKEFGELYAGMRGTLRVGSGNTSSFVPSGY